MRCGVSVPLPKPSPICPKLHTIAASLCVAATLITACSPDGPECETQAIPITDLSAAIAPSNLSGNSIIQRAFGTYPVVFYRSETPGSPQNLSFQPNSDQVKGTLTVGPVWSDFNQVVSTLKPCSGWGCTDNFVSCPDYFQLKVEVQLQSEDGAFAERWTADLRAYDPSDPEVQTTSTGALPNTNPAELKVLLDPYTFSGSFQFQNASLPAPQQLSGHYLEFVAYFKQSSLEMANLNSYMEGRYHRFGADTGVTHSLQELYIIEPSTAF